MPDRYSVPSASPLDDIIQWRGLLLAAVDSALGFPDVWEEGQETTALGYVEDLKLWISLYMKPPDYARIEDQKTQNTAGGGFTSGAWQTRTLNTKVEDAAGFVSLASNQITLPAGIYRLRGSAPACYCKNHQVRWRNVTDGATVLTGTVEYTDNTTATVVQTRSFVEGEFTIASQKTFELQHQCNTTRGTNGFGVAGNLTIEIYSVVEIWRIG